MEEEAILTVAEAVEQRREADKKEATGTAEMVPKWQRSGRGKTSISKSTAARRLRPWYPAAAAGSGGEQ